MEELLRKRSINLENRLMQLTDRAIMNYQKANQIIIDYKENLKLKETIVESLILNNSFNWIHGTGFNLVRTPRQMLQLMQLRRRVYELVNYSEEFPEPVPGLMYDEFDKKSAIFIYSRPEIGITATIRIVLDYGVLPSEDKFSFQQFRQNGKIGELSRQVIDPKFHASGIEFRKLYEGIYLFGLRNGFDSFVAGINREHLRLYEKFGGIEVLGELDSYGRIHNKSLIMSWRINQVSNFFKKAFLKK